MGATGHGQDLGDRQKQVLLGVPPPVVLWGHGDSGERDDPPETLPMHVQCCQTPLECFFSLVNEAKPRFPAALEWVNPPRVKSGCGETSGGCFPAASASTRSHGGSWVREASGRRFGLASDSQNLPGTSWHLELSLCFHLKLGLGAKAPLGLS